MAIPAEPELWRVLLVEDDEDDYLITRGMLLREQRARFELDWCPGYDEAVPVIREGRHDVYLIDYRLGARDGLDLIREALPGLGHPPVILLTGQGDHDLDVRAAALGVTDYLVKQELNPGGLERSLRYAISRHRSEALVREAERESRAAAEAYRLLFDNNPQAMWVHDTTSGEIFEVNDAALAQYGYPRERVLSMRVSELFPPDAPAVAFHADYWEREPTMAATQRHADGSLIEVELVSHVLQFRGRRGRLVMASDVTDRKRLERHLAETQRLESLGQLAGGVAHDFNNLLGVILNYAVFVSERINAEAGLDPHAWESVRADVSQIEQAGRRAAQLTKQLLAFARREAAHPDVISIGEVVAETDRMLRRSLGEHIELQCKFDAGLWPVRADPGQIQQVLVNLAVNGRDAMPHGGTLRIEADNVEIGPTEADAVIAGGGPHVRLRVSDTGVGMDEAVAARAFEPFYTTKPKGEGTGLGLATTYGIVTQAGGSIQIDSAPGRGTTFTVLLPASRESVSAPPEPLGAPEHGGGEVILLVEDQRSLLEVARRLLVRRGYVVLTASGGVEALELAARHEGRIDLLLTDVVMPGMSGPEVAERLAALRPGIGVVYMSGYAEPVLDAAATISAGAVLLEKPFTEQSLVAGVARALAAARPARTRAFQA